MREKNRTKVIELEIKGKKIIGTIDDKNSSFGIITDIIGKRGAHLSFSGITFDDKDIKESYRWYEGDLKEGDEFIVRVIEK